MPAVGNAIDASFQETNARAVMSFRGRPYPVQAHPRSFIAVGIGGIVYDPQLLKLKRVCGSDKKTGLRSLRETVGARGISNSRCTQAEGMPDTVCTVTAPEICLSVL